ncbi:MAG TPA: hypothetical protein VGO46_15135 [Gemmatimonadaceae bacterium]|nr:hypothetical protein [Gemmatimonadaceae bacterium]
MAEIEITDTHRRAALRGRESVARWRIESGVWSGRLYGVFYGVLALLPLVSGGIAERRWVEATMLVLLAASILVATEQMKRGSRLVACLLFALFAAAQFSEWRTQGRSSLSGVFWAVLIAGGLANGIWGTFALAKVQHDALGVPPAPSREEKARQQR